MKSFSSKTKNLLISSFLIISLTIESSAKSNIWELFNSEILGFNIFKGIRFSFLNSYTNIRYKIIMH